MNDHALFGSITQLGHVTNDIETTARAWTDATGIGPWTLMKGVVMDATMDGEPSAIKIDVALAYQGDLQIELIKPLDNARSPYNEYANAGISGLHHVQYTTDNINATLAKANAAGLQTVCFIDQGGGKYAYLKGPGIWFEVMEASEALHGLFAMIKANSIDWDGKDLIRELGL